MPGQRTHTRLWLSSAPTGSMRRQTTCARRSPVCAAITGQGWYDAACDAPAGRKAPPPSDGRRGLRAGFTLVEMLVTLMIGALLIVASVSATRALTTARAGVERRTQRVAEARRAMEVIVAGLRNISRDPPARKPLLVGRSGGHGAGNDQISFLAIDNRRVRPDGPESDLHETGFFLAAGGAGTLPRLMCRRDHAFDEYPEEGGIATAVAENIVSLGFEYFSAGDWYPEWRATESRPPQAVRVTLVAVTPPEPGSTRAADTTVLTSVVAIRANEPQQAPQPNQGRPNSNDSGNPGPNVNEGGPG